MGSKTSIADWFAITSQEGRKGWLQFYKSMLGVPLSKPDKFFQLVENLGHMVMFEAVVSTSTRSLEGDPFSYVMAVAVAKANDQIEAMVAADRYALNIAKAKQRTELQNEELENRIQKALGEDNVATR